MLGFITAVLIVLILLALAFPFVIKPSARKHVLTCEIKKYRYAHRGFFSPEKGVPENSLAAFRAAIDNGYGFELDVHLTADKKLAVIHDSSLKRTAGVDIDVSKAAYHEICGYGLEGTEEKIPLFEDVLKLNSGRVPMIIELKTDMGNARELAEKVVEALQNYNGIYCIESFYPDVLLALKQIRPDVMRGQLSCDVRRTDKKFSRLKNFFLKNLLTNFLTKPDFIAYAHEDRDCFSYSLCRALFTPTEFLWTVRDKDTMKKAESVGAGVIFDGFDPSKE